MYLSGVRKFAVISDERAKKEKKKKELVNETYSLGLSFILLLFRKIVIISLKKIRFISGCKLTQIDLNSTM